MSYYSYILKSEYDGTHYYGSCADLGDRLKQHNKGKSRYTKGRRPWKHHFHEEFETRSEAREIEIFFPAQLNVEIRTSIVLHI